jgi:hypothetical protein
MTAIARHPDVLNLARFGLFSWQVWSHKMMRWAVPWFLMLLFVTNAALLGRSPFYALSFAAQVIFYLAALAAHASERVKQNAAIRIIYFFVQVNFAIADATVRLTRGTRMTTWTPSTR